MDSSCLTASTDQTKPGPSDRGEKGSGEGWWNWPPSIIFFKGTKADVGYPPKFIYLNLETTWHYQMIPKLWDLHVGWLQSLQICTSIRPCHDILHGLRVRLFVSSPMLWRIKGMGGVGRLTGRPSGLGKGAGTTVWTLSCKVCFCQIGCLWCCGNSYLILQVKIQYIHALWYI